MALAVLPRDDVAIGQQSLEFAARDDRHRADAILRHEPRGILGGVVGQHRHDVLRHDVLDCFLHGENLLN